MRSRALVVGATAIVLTGCRSDGRTLREPTAELPPTTTVEVSLDAGLALLEPPTTELP